MQPPKEPASNDVKTQHPQEGVRGRSRSSNMPTGRSDHQHPNATTHLNHQHPASKQDVQRTKQISYPQPNPPDRQMSSPFMQAAFQLT